MGVITTRHAKDLGFVRRGGSGRTLLVPGTYKPSDATTGSLQSTLPAYNATTIDMLVITEDNTTLQNLTIYGDIHIRARNVTLRNCILKGGTNAPSSASGVVNCNSNKCFNALIEDCTIKPHKPHYFRDGIVGHEYTARRNRVSHTTDGFGAFITTANGTDTNVALEANYVSDLTYWYPDGGVHSDGTHNDCLQIQGGANIHVIGNYFYGTSVLGAGSQPNPDKPRLLSESPPKIQGSCIIVQKQTSTAALANVVIEKNWLNNAQGGFNMKPGSYTFRDNLFGRDWYDYNKLNGYTTSQYPMRGDDSTQTNVTGLYTSNRWEDTGVLLSGKANGGTRFDGIRWNDIPD